MTLTEHQKIWSGKCPICGCDIYWDEDQERNVFTCDCMVELDEEGNEVGYSDDSIFE